ncbi:MAG TPA: cytochrome c [Terriglobales bacterium]|jgi:mono/diheme cytochrome c family protein|nr:cytochrome c [Terriglobales bacterium]
MSATTKRTLPGLLLAAALLGLAGCQSRVPGSAETSAAYFVKQNVTFRAKGDNPFPATKENILAGQRAFSSYCTVCHGLDGQNTGVPFAKKMSPPVPSLASPRVQAYSDAQLKRVVESGIFPSGMPAAKGTLSDEEIWEIVVFLRHLPPPGSLGEPSIYSGN